MNKILDFDWKGGYTRGNNWIYVGVYNRWKKLNFCLEDVMNEENVDFKKMMKWIGFLQGAYSEWYIY